MDEPGEMGTDIMCRSADMKKSSRPSRLHRGSDPPAFDTRVLTAVIETARRTS